jgi:hypothetical protein
LSVVFEGTAVALTSVTPEQHRSTQPPAKAVIPIPTRQVIVLSRGLNASPEQHAAHAEISRMSPNARHLVVAGSDHEIHLSHPDVVIAAIRDVVASVRAKALLP